MNDTLYIEGFGAVSSYESLADFPHGPAAELPKLDLSLLERSLRRGLSDVTRLFMHAAQLALHDAAVSAEDLHIVFASAFGELGTAEALMDLAVSENGSSPARFRHSVHNAAPGLLSISAHNVRASTAIAAGWDTVAMGLLEAQALLLAGEKRVLLVFADELIPRSLSDAHVYGPVGVAFVLSQTLGTIPPRATLSRLKRASREQSSLRDPFAGPNHPLGPAMFLAQTLANAGTETVQLGEGPQPWCVELRALRPATREPTAEVAR
ncbi:MAG: beta-ketoacyl synthase chain length factor [Myxococcales bacterium]